MLDDFLGSAADGVHGLHPAYRIGCFQFLRDALGLGHLLDNQAAPFGGLFIQVGQDGIQLPRQKQRLIKDLGRMMPTLLGCPITIGSMSKVM